MLRQLASIRSGVCVEDFTQEDESNPDASIVLNATEKPAAARLWNVLRDLFRESFGKDVIVDDFVASNLTAPGENNGSTMFGVTVTVWRNESAEPEVIHAVAKMLPNKIFQDLFNSQVSFPKEIAAYEAILPAYQQFQRENGVPNDKVFDILPKCYGFRMPGDLKSTNRDDDAVILLENLKASGYSCGNRVEGLDLAHSEMVVRNLATFHALGIATRMKKPEWFDAFNIKEIAITFPASAIASTVESRKNMALQGERLKPFYERIAKALDVGAEKLYATPSNHFGTIAHMDFWVNNIMFHRDAEGNPDAVKFIDFQTYSYQSPVKDLLFFLITSTMENVLLRNFDHLLNLYHEQFIKTLDEFGCDVDAYGKAHFLAECKEWAAAVVLHCCMMVKVVLLPECKAEVDSKVERSEDYFEKLDFEACRERLTLMFQCFLERDWI